MEFNLISLYRKVIAGTVTFVNQLFYCFRTEQSPGSSSSNHKYAINATIIKKGHLLIGGLFLMLMLVVIAISSCSPPTPCSTEPLDSTTEDIHWTFENHDLECWTKTGDAFTSQPTYGNNISTSRSMEGTPLVENIQNNIGGDYWDGPYPIGIEGNYWIGTYEDRNNLSDPWGTVQGDDVMGTLTSPEFFFDGDKTISFLIGGGCNDQMVGVKMQIFIDDGWIDLPQYKTGELENGICSEKLKRVAFEFADNVSEPPQNLNPWPPIGIDLTKLPPELQPQETFKYRIVIYDNSTTEHINVDDIVIVDDIPADIRQPVWGFADTHAHLAAHLAFGGALVWGDPDDIENDTAQFLDDLGLAHHINSGHGAQRLIVQLDDEYLYGRKFAELCPDGFDLLDDFFASVASIFGENTENSFGSCAHRASNVFEFSEWYNVTHQRMYVKWLRRAYDGGLRLLVTDAVNNRAMNFGVTKGATPLEVANCPELLGARLFPYYPQTDSYSYIAQICYIRNLVNDNSDWMEIALSPRHARDIINQNKLAIILGIEVDSFGDCDLRALSSNVTHHAGGSSYFHADTTVCNWDFVISQLDLLYEMGVRQIQPIHLTDNGFGGAAVYNDLFNTANHFLNGGFFDVENARGRVDWTFGDTEVIRNDTLPFFDIDVSLSPHAEPAPREYSYNYQGHVNQQGLTPTGRNFIRAMMERGMLIAVDHMSQKALDELIGLSYHNDPILDPFPTVATGCLDLNEPSCLEAAYPVALTHTSFRDLQFALEETTDRGKLRNEISKRQDQIRRILWMGGIVAPGMGPVDYRAYHNEFLQDHILSGSDVENDCAGSSRTFAQAYKYVWAEEIVGSGIVGIPFGTDFNGLWASPNPRFGRQGCWARSSGFFDPTFYSEVQTEGTNNDEQRLMQRINSKLVFYEHYNDDPRTSGGQIIISVPPYPPAPYTINTSMPPLIASQLSGQVYYNGIYPTMLALGYDEDDALAFCTGDLDLDLSLALSSEELPDIVRVLIEDFGEGAQNILRGRGCGAEYFSKTWDVNTDGVAHYGMLPDFFQDLRVVGFSQEDLGPLFSGAEAYIQMWEKACSLSDPVASRAGCE